jgi:hypothetical protein
MHEMKYLSDHLLFVLFAILLKRPLALFCTTRPFCDQFLGLNLDAIAARKSNYDPEGFVRANSGHGTINCSTG